MSQYGEILDGGYEPENEYVYKLFVNYFNNPIMTKVKDQGDFSLYANKVYCLLSKECRYIIAITNKDYYSIGTTEELRTIKWVSFQTRTLKEELKTKVDLHGYEAKAEGPLTDVIRRKKIDESASTYLCDTLPLKITLLHNERKKANSYQDKGTVIAALETWETIVTFIDEEVN